MKVIRGFFLFWYDFLIGDAWEVAAGVVVVLAALWLALRFGGDAWTPVAVVGLPLAVILLLAFSLWRARPPA